MIKYNDKTQVTEWIKKYNMFFVRHYITGEALAVRCISDELIPELDEYANSTKVPPRCAQIVREYDTSYMYTIYLPESWHLCDMPAREYE